MDLNKPVRIKAVQVKGTDRWDVIKNGNPVFTGIFKSQIDYYKRRARNEDATRIQQLKCSETLLKTLATKH